MDDMTLMIASKHSKFHAHFSFRKKKYLKRPCSFVHTWDEINFYLHFETKVT